LQHRQRARLRWDARQGHERAVHGQTALHRQAAQFIGSRVNPQGAKRISSRFALLLASRAIHADAPG
jgi:hypothetical protein